MKNPTTHLPHAGSPADTNIEKAQRANLARQLKQNQIIREHAREMINPQELIIEILEIRDQMQLSVPSEEQLRRNPNERGEAPDSQVLNALKARSDINFRLLDKALPNLRSMEVTATHDHNHSGSVDLVKVTDIELAQRLQLWQAQQRAIANDPDVIDITPTVVVEEEYDFL